MTDRLKHIRVFAGEARKRGDIETLLELLTGTDAAGRLSAVHNLGDLRDPAGAQPLTRRLNAQDPGMRTGILRALAKIGDTTIETLAALGDPRAVRLFGAALREKNVPHHRWFRKWAAKHRYPD